MTPLPGELLKLLNRPSPCFIATTMPDGSPQLTQTWVDTDGEHILINTVEGYRKTKNVQRDPRVADRHPLERRPPRQPGQDSGHQHFLPQTRRRPESSVTRWHK